MSENKVFRESPFTDKNGVPLKEGEYVSIVINVVVGEERHRNGRNSRSFSTYSIRADKEVVFQLQFGWFKTIHDGEVFTWWLYTDSSQTYNTHFWAGLGYTKAQKAANEWTPYTTNNSRILSKSLAQRCELVTNLKPII